MVYTGLNCHFGPNIVNYKKYICSLFKHRINCGSIIRSDSPKTQMIAQYFPELDSPAALGIPIQSVSGDLAATVARLCPEMVVPVITESIIAQHYQGLRYQPSQAFLLNSTVISLFFVTKMPT